MTKWKLRHHGYCPFCQQEEEYTKHILQCTHNTAIKISKDTIWVFVKKLIQIGTCSRLTMALKVELTAWRNNMPRPSLTSLPQDIRIVIIAQRKIGWKTFLEGLISVEWKKYQKEYFREIESTRSSDLWASKVIRECMLEIHHRHMGRKKCTTT